MAEVGQPALALVEREHPGRQALVDHHGLGECCHPAVPEDPGPPVKTPVHPLPLLVGGCGDALGRPPEERGERRAPDPQRRRRPLQRLEQAQPFARHRCR